MAYRNNIDGCIQPTFRSLNLNVGYKFTSLLSVYTCQEGCPQGVEVVDSILKIRTLAVEEGIMPDPDRVVAQNIYKYGMAVPIDEKKTWKNERV